MKPRNEIIIEGVRHVLNTNCGFYPCRMCSVQHLCEDNPICQKLFGKTGFFEIKKSKSK